LLRRAEGGENKDMGSRKTGRRLERHLEVRIDDELLGHIQAIAKKEGRSLNSQILRCIRSYVYGATGISGQGWRVSPSVLAQVTAVTKERLARVRAKLEAAERAVDEALEST